MGDNAYPVVHFEIIGQDPAALRHYYRQLFGWDFGVGDATTTEVSAPGEYGFVDGSKTRAEDGTIGINGGIGGGNGYQSRVLFYVAVPDVETALRQAEQLGGKRLMGPARAPDGPLEVGRFVDPEGHVVGVAGAANE